MRETTFIRQNREKWAAIEQKTQDVNLLSVDELVKTYRDVLADLSLAQTQFPDSKLVAYLNGMAKKLHDRLYAPAKKTLLERFSEMMLRRVPQVVCESRYELLAAVVLFLFFVLGGIIKVLVDPEDVRNVLGNRYVEMTLGNIAQGVPTHVYDMAPCGKMFTSILWNNVIVGLRTYAFGFMPFVGTIYSLNANGVMLGEFQTFFFQHGVGLQSAAAIWIHGTLEITGLLIEAAAAIRLSRAIYVRRTYSFADNLRIHGQQSVLLYLSSLPLTLTAALMESYVTRHVEWPIAVRLSFIVVSLAFVIWYYIILPVAVWKRGK